MSTSQSCKTCKWYGVVPNVNGRIVVRKGFVWPCNAPNPDMPIIPSSVIKMFLWKWPPHRAHMEGSEGSDCRTYAPRKAEKLGRKANRK